MRGELVSLSGYYPDLSTMDPERWEKLDELFHSALELESGERDAFISEACGDNTALRQELESMLTHHEQAENFIESPAYALAAETLVGDDTDSLVGKSVGTYQVLGELGAGGMGVVYLAIDKELGRKIALKLLPPHLTGDKHRVQRFKQEARAASALNHPNILTIHEIGEINGQHFIATEFVEGKTLRELLSLGPTRLREALDIATQIAAALSAVHTAGIIHRDIKPENIMVRPDGQIKIIDFGVAKLSEIVTLDSEAPTFIKTETGRAMGTVRYMSPEQVRALDVDAGTDIWSFGVVLYEMIAGCFPFAGETAGDLIVSILGSDPQPLSQRKLEVPAELERIVSKALAKERARRYETAEAMLFDLRQLRARLDAGERIGTTRHKRTKAIALSAVGIAIVLSATGVGWKLLNRVDQPPLGSNANRVTIAPAAERTLKYSLMVQRMQNGRPYDPPFFSNGRENFGKGWKFRLNLSSPQAGFLYLLGEGPSPSGGAGLTILYPDTEKGSIPIQVASGQTTETEWYVFDENPGTEKLWMIWSARAAPELESVRRLLNPKDKGFISNSAESRAVQEFLAAHAEAHPQLEEDADHKETTAKAKGDVLVYGLELRHQ